MIKTTHLPDEPNKSAIVRYPSSHKGESFIIPDYVTSIEEGAFEGCSGLTEIEIPDSVTSIGNYAFRNCSGLTEINVDTGNEDYTSIDGVLYNKNKSAIVCYPSSHKGESFIIPDSVTSIGDKAFEGCSGLTKIEIPDSVTSIGYWAFAGCSGLTEIHIKLRDISTITDKSLFEGVCKELCTLYVPIGKGYAYRHHPVFGDFPNIVLER